MKRATGSAGGEGAGADIALANVAADDHAGRRGARAGHTEGGRLRIVIEQALAAAQHDRIDQQAQFVDDPGMAVGAADMLVNEVMTTRGYPMAEWEQRYEDLTVDHAGVCHHYREARDIVIRHAAGGASTEDLRQALVHYRALFADLLDDVTATVPRR